MPLVPTVIVKLATQNVSLIDGDLLPSNQPNLAALFPAPDYQNTTFNPNALILRTFAEYNNPSIWPGLDPMVSLNTKINGEPDGGVRLSCLSQESGSFAFRRFNTNGVVFLEEYELIFDDDLVQNGTFEIAGFAPSNLFFLQGFDSLGNFAFIGINSGSGDGDPPEYFIFRLPDVDGTTLNSLNSDGLFTATVREIDGLFYTSFFTDYTPSIATRRPASMQVKNAVSLPCYGPCLPYGLKRGI